MAADGKDNYEADRDAARRATALFPELPALAKANRRFLEEAVTRAARAGITQYLDLGAGLPTSPNTHEVASRYIDAPHVVYADRDPVVVTHSAAMRHVPGTNASPQGRTQAEIRALFGDWPLIEPPGLADVRTWAGGAAPGQGDLLMSAGIAVKP